MEGSDKESASTNKDSTSSAQELEEKCDTALDAQLQLAQLQFKVPSSPTTSSVTSPEEGTDPAVNREALTETMTNLQKKTKVLQTRFAHERNGLQQLALLVETSSEACEQSNRRAALLTHHVGWMSMVPNSGELLQLAIDYPNPVSRPTPSPAPLQRQLTVEKKQTPPTREELTEQVAALQQLVGELTLQHPYLKPQVLQLAKDNPKLNGVELFAPRISGGGGYPQPTCSQNAGVSEHHLEADRSLSSMPPAAETCDERGRLESEVSNGSATAGVAKIGKRNRKRNRNKHRQKPKCQESERSALAKYINAVVAAYMGERWKKHADELRFHPERDADDLEAYAQRLVSAGLGRIVEDEIRVNRKNNRQSFITMSADREGSERDGIVLLPVARKYAFDGDIVRAFVLNAGGATPTVTNEVDEKRTTAKVETITGGKEHSFCIADDDDDLCVPNDDDDADDSEFETADVAVAVTDNCPKSFVIAIVRQSEQRQIVGNITFKSAVELNDQQLYYKLKPHDMRVPMVYVPVAECAKEPTDPMHQDDNDICGLIYVVRVTETDAHGHCRGELLQRVGRVGNLGAEIRAILLHNGLRDLQPYEQRFNDLFAWPDPPLSADDLQQRKDLRNRCIFTIDPMTARDLDDAVSVERIGHGEFEVGVHISDVSHYLHEHSELDEIVKGRATSVYLVNEVIHMLPQTLCAKCSLLPGEDKFAFSVFWRMNLHGEVLGQPRFLRTIINSCSQFAYEHAQMVIDNPRERFGIDDLPTICNGFTPEEVTARILTLHALAQQLRVKRYAAGALSINNPKLRFTLNVQSGEPIAYELDARDEANFLIEEFMLLANQSVARFIYDSFPDIALLRNHAPPLSKSMRALRDKLANMGIAFDVSSSKAIYASMQRICHEAKDPAAMDACLSTLLTKPMARAKYFCSEGISDEGDLWHYALSIPIYTHFTSPIRRYPDILVHRVLAAALNYCPAPMRTAEELHQLAKVCNDQKFNAKSAGDDSINLFFKRYIKARQSLTMRAAVTEIYQHLLNVVIIETGHCIAINYKTQKVLVDTTHAPAYVLISEKNSRLAPVRLQVFTAIDVRLVVWDGKICGFFASPDPKQRHLNSIEATKNKAVGLDEEQKCTSRLCVILKNKLGRNSKSNSNNNGHGSSSSKRDQKAARRLGFQQ